MSTLNSPLVSKLIELAIAEDLSYGDPSAMLLDSDKVVSAELVAKQSLVVCGLDLTDLIAKTANKEFESKNLVAEGEQVQEGTILQAITGKSADIISLERIILNFIQRLSGVSTYTRSVISKAGNIAVLDTRKTTPGFRILEKYATKVGGAKNHRMHLGQMLMIKNNHIDASVGKDIPSKIKNLIDKIKSDAGFYVPYQIEIRNMQELEVVLEFQPQFILLDNMSDKELQASLQLVNQKSPKTVCEVSGGITVDRFVALAKMGVEVVSMGALTTQATNVDISLRIK